MFATIAELSSDVLWYHDLEVVVGEPYYYYLTTFDAEGHESTMHTRTSDPMIATKPTSVGEADAPDLYVLGQNVPNPFNASTTIRFSVPHEGDGKREVRLDVYSPDGRLIRTLVSGMAGSGQHEVVWDATDSRGKPVGSGTYLYRLDVGDKVGIKRMTLVR